VWRHHSSTGVAGGVGIERSIDGINLAEWGTSGAQGTPGGSGWQWAVGIVAVLLGVWSYIPCGAISLP